MKQEINEIEVNGVKYTRADQAAKCEELDGEYSVVRTYSAGVFFGILKDRNGKEGTVLNARRVFYWSGAASLSQLSIDGTSKPNDCKFPEAVSSVLLTEIIEVLPLTKKAKQSLDGVKIWKQ